MSAKPAIQIGISACLLGQTVRYDGGHKRDRFCESLTDTFEFIELCPEMAIGLGTPRPTIRLEDHGGNIIARQVGGADHTQALVDYGREQANKLTDISAYIFCAKSPSCGMERVKVYDGDSKNNIATGVGIYAEQIMTAKPLLPVEESGRLNDAVIRENFITRVYAYHEWQCLIASGLNAKNILEFHRAYKYLLLAHNPKIYRELGPLLADLSGDLESKAEEYFTGFMTALKSKANRGNHCNVLQHIQGFVSNQLEDDQRQELSQSILKYREGIVPLLVPLSLLKHHLMRCDTSFIQEQRYLDPHPETMRLRYSL